MEKQLTDFWILKNETRPALRDVIMESFKEDLPIKGGWGYSIEDAIIIDRNDSTVDKSIPFPGVSIEYNIVEKRLYEELFFFRPKSNRFFDIHWVRELQTLTGVGERRYDFLKVKGYCFSEQDYLSLREEFMQRENNQEFDIQKHLEKRMQLMYHFTTEYYFDITSFFGKK